MGDFNFDDCQTWGDWKHAEPQRSPEQLENTLTLQDALPGWMDCWPSVHPSERGITFDGQFNRPAVHNRGEVMRYDRVMARGDLRPVAAVLQGTAPINDWGLRPSDHYAVCVDLEGA